MKKFSIVFPTRERPKLLKNILDSIASTTSNLADIEALIAYDSDDAITAEFIINNGHKYTFALFVCCTRSLNFSRDYYSMLAKRSTGKWIVVVNDDAQFTTPGWDRIAEEALTKATAGRANVIYGWVEDELKENRMTELNDYTCFPIMGRAGVEAIGGVFPDRIPTWGADIWARFIYGEIRRVVKVPITIKHISHHNGTREKDAINDHVASNQIKYDMNPTDEEINKLLAAMRGNK